MLNIDAGIKTPLICGQYVRVKANVYPKGGKDGRVLEMLSEDRVALTFGYDRHCEDQDVVCVGPEEWELAELDLSTAI